MINISIVARFLRIVWLCDFVPIYPCISISPCKLCLHVHPASGVNYDHDGPHSHLNCEEWTALIMILKDLGHLLILR